MKRILLLFTCISLSTALAQENENTSGLEKTIFGVQTGFLGVYAYNETKLAENVALRTEIGFDAGINKNILKGSSLVLYPKLSLEPRYYYNMKKRSEAGKNTNNNAANYFSLYINHHPDWFLLFDDKDRVVIPDLMIAPTWGMRRNIAENWNVELGGGLGYVHSFRKSQGFASDDGQLGMHLLLRIGYVF